MDPVIPADILLVLALVVIGGPVAWLAGRWLIAGAVEARSRLMRAAHARTRATVEDDSGNGGGWPVDASGYPTILPKTMAEYGPYDAALDRFFARRAGDMRPTGGR